MMIIQKRALAIVICVGFTLLLTVLVIAPTKIFSATNTIIVNSLDDEGGSCSSKKCTLRQAINDASSGETINFDADILPGTIVISDTLGELTIDKDLTIHNNNKFDLTISGNRATRIFHVAYNYSLTLENIIFTEGWSYGGAIWNEQGYVSVENCRFEANGSTSASSGPIYNQLGTLEIDRSVFFENEGNYGGAIENSGIMTITNTTFEDNTAGSYGGAIHNTLGSIYDMELTIENSTFTGNESLGLGGSAIFSQSHGGVNITNSTFYQNVASGDGGTIYQASANQGDEYLSIIHSTIAENYASTSSYSAGVVSLGYLKIINSILANNDIIGSTDVDCYWNLGGSGIFIHNLIMNNASGDYACGTPIETSGPGLLGLANNGGVTYTMALVSTSPAIDVGHADHCPPTDQRGFPRPQGAGCDLGAYELDSFPFVLSIETADPNPTDEAYVDFTVTFNEAVTGVDETDFSPTIDGLTVANITEVVGMDDQYTVTVYTRGTGTLRLDLDDDNTIEDATSNPLGGAGIGDGDFDGGEVYILRYNFIYLPLILK